MMMVTSKRPLIRTTIPRYYNITIQRYHDTHVSPHMSYLLLLKEILMFTNDDDGDQEEAASDTRPHHGKQGVL